MKKIECMVCGSGLKVTTGQSRKSKNPKKFIALACPINGRHFRGFIADQDFVAGVIEKAAIASSEPQEPAPTENVEEPA